LNPNPGIIAEFDCSIAGVFIWWRHKHLNPPFSSGERQLTEASLQISVHETENTVVSLRGEVDYHNAQSIRDAINPLLSQGKYNLSLDVANLEFIDSSGLSALMDAARAARSNGGQVSLLEPSPQLIHVLTIAGFAPFFSIAPGDGAAKKRAVTPPAARTQTTWQVTQFEVPPQTELIADIRNRVASFAKELPFTEQDIEDIKLAVGEASSNALRYGCPKSDDNILVRCSHDGQSLRVQIKDNGPCFDPDSITPPPIDALDEGGRGIYFMKVLMDEVKFYFSSGGSTVELVKHAV
jgi:serine/threonine-protein kinase RsbW